MANKKTLLIVRIRLADGRWMRPIECTKKDGWTKTQIQQFVKGLKSAYPDCEVQVNTSTVSDGD